MTLREIIYMIMDELKLLSDDSNFNEGHIRFLVGKYRIFLLNQAYSTGAADIADANYQTISLQLEQIKAIPELNSSRVYLKSVEKIPNTLDYTSRKVFSYLNNYNIAVVSKDRFKFVGHNKWTKNNIYCTVINNYLYLTSNNPQYLYLENVDYKAVFEDVEKAFLINNPDDDYLDMDYPLESGLVPALIQAVVQDLAPKTVQPEDSYNNAADDKSNIANYIARNQKQNVQ